MCIRKQESDLLIRENYLMPKSDLIAIRLTALERQTSDHTHPNRLHVPPLNHGGFHRVYMLSRLHGLLRLFRDVKLQQK